MVVCYPGYLDIFKCFPSFAVLVCRFWGSKWVLRILQSECRACPGKRSCSDAPLLRSGACTSPHVLLYSVGSVLLDGARLPQPYAPTFRCSTPLHSCQLLKSCTPMLRSSLESAPLHSAAALPLRCSAPLRSPPLRCSAPLRCANLCSDAPLHLVRQLFRSDAPLLRCSMHFAPLRNPPLRCSAAQSSAALILHGAPLRSPPLRCSDAPLRSAALVLTFCAPMLRCWDAIAQLTCSAQRRSSAPAQVQPITTAQRRSSAAAHRRNCNQTTAQRRSSAAAHWRKRSLTTAQRRSSAQAQGNNSTAAQRNLTTAQRRSSRESIARTYRLERRSGAAAQSSLRTHIAPTLDIGQNYKESSCCKKCVLPAQNLSFLLFRGRRT